MRIVMFLYCCVMPCCIHLRISRYVSSCAFVCSCGMYAVIAMMGVPSCGVSMATLMWSLRFVGICMGVASL